MSEIGITVAIVLGILNAFVLGIKMRKDSKSNKNNPGNLPCAENTERIAVVETEIKNIKEDIREIKNKIMEGQNGF